MLPFGGCHIIISGDFFQIKTMGMSLIERLGLGQKPEVVIGIDSLHNFKGE